MKTATAALILVLTQSLIAGDAFAAGARKSDHPRPPEGYAGQWYTTPGGCSYSRAQAPGYPVTWHLIINPHHIGKPNATRRCPIML